MSKQEGGSAQGEIRLKWMAAFLSLPLATAACNQSVHQILFGPGKVVINEQRPPAPSPSPTIAPSPPASIPEPEPSPEGGDDFPDNTAPVAKVGAKVFFVECAGEEMPGSEYATSAPVGCRLHMDCTPKDVYNQPTRARGIPHWSLTNNALVSGGSLNVYTPTFLITGRGTLTLSVTVDGIESNPVTVAFY